MNGYAMIVTLETKTKKSTLYLYCPLCGAEEAIGVVATEAEDLEELSEGIELSCDSCDQIYTVMVVV